MLPKLLRYSNYRKLYIAGFISELGLFTTETALMLHVFSLSGEKNSILGLSRMSFLFFLTLGNLTGGAIGARFNRKFILIYSELIRIPIVLSILFLDNPYLIILMMGLTSFFSGTFNPNRQTLVNEIVPQNDIDSANALFSSTMAILLVCGPLLGSLLYSKLQSIDYILYFDLATYLAGILLLLSIKYKRGQEKDKEKDKEKEINEEEPPFGLQDFQYVKNFISSRKDLIALICNTAITGLCIGILIPLILPFTLEVLKKTTQDYGVMLSLFGLGGIVGGYLSKRLRGVYPLGKILVGTLILESILFVVFSQTRIYFAAIAVFLFWGICVFVRIPSQLNYYSSSVKTNMLPRMFSIGELAFIIPNMLGSLFIVFYGDQLKVEKILLFTGVLFVLLVMIGLKTKFVRELIKGPPYLVKRDAELFDSLD